MSAKESKSVDWQAQADRLATARDAQTRRAEEAEAKLARIENAGAMGDFSDRNFPDVPELLRAYVLHLEERQRNMVRNSVEDADRHHREWQAWFLAIKERDAALRVARGDMQRAWREIEQDREVKAMKYLAEAGHRISAVLGDCKPEADA